MILHQRFTVCPLASNESRPAVFLDRDGVINQNRAGHVCSWDDVEFLPGVFAALERLAGSDFTAVIITNQAAVGRGLLAPEALEAIHAGMVQQISARGGRIDAIYACPHRPEEDCDCRKPEPGMLLQAAVDLGIDLAVSYFVGDAVSDVEAGLAAGCQPILVRSGRGEAQLPLFRANGYQDVPVVADLAEAVAWILGQERTTANWDGNKEGRESFAGSC